MAHELSMIDGKAEMAYAGKRPWHGLGTQLPGTMTTAEALTAAHLEWSVEKVPALSSFDMSVIPDTYAVLRSDNHKPIGIVGDKYTCIPNKDAFAFFDGVLGEGQATIETAAALFGGSKVFLMSRLPEITEIIPGDTMERFLLVSTSHDGSSSTEVMFTNVRVVCNNTLQCALRGQKNRIKIRHTENYKERMAAAQTVLMESKSYWSKFQEMAQHLAKTSVDRVEVGSFIEIMFPKKEDEKNTQVEKARNKFSQLLETGMGTEIPGVKGTAWSLFNAFSEYTQYGKRVNGITDEAAMNTKRWENLVFGQAGNDLQKALDQCLAIAS